MINNLERIFLRAKKNKLIPSNLSLEDYRFQSVTKTFQLPASSSVAGVPVDFPMGAIIVSAAMDAGVNNLAGTAARGNLDMIRVAMDLPSSDGTLTSGGAVRASCLFGRDGTKQWPEKEVIMPRQGSINVSVTNLTSSVLDVDLSFNVLLPRGAG
jgi:hypothetical protein